MFDATPKPRELNEEEIDKFDLRRIYDGEDKPLKVRQPSFETSTIIWASAGTKTDPIYRLYDRGTNSLFVLRYNWQNDEWEQIDYTKIDNLYGMLWLLCLKIDGLKYNQCKCKDVNSKI